MTHKFLGTSTMSHAKVVPPGELPPVGKAEAHAIETMTLPLSAVTKASLFRAYRYGEQLYSVVLTRCGEGRIEERHEILSHGYGCDRYCIAGGNAGMPRPSTFQGNPMGVLVDGNWHVERVKKLEGFDSGQITES